MPSAPTTSTPPALTTTPAAVTPVGPALSIRELSYSYRRTGSEGGGGDEPFTLTIPALDLQPGQQMLITGSSGCGKSTLLSLIAGLLEAKHGRIAVAGTDMVALRGAARDAHRGRHIGMIFQTLHLVGGMTATENVELALMFSTLPPSEHRQRARYLLDRLGLSASHADRLAERLSVGQQQRVAIARAVACKPALVLADEPTAALDPDNARAAMDLIQTSCREAGAALLCVSHDTSIAERFLYRCTLADLVAGRVGGGHLST